MSVNPNHLRPGNWIYPTGRSKYVVVTGLLLGMMEKNEDLCKEFEGIELTGELLEAAGFIKSDDKYGGWRGPIRILKDDSGFLWQLSNKQVRLQFLHQLQNLTLALTESELTLPDSALIIPLATP